MRVTLELPKSELFRLQTFVDDIIELTNNEFDYSIEDLISLVYLDLLQSVRKGKLKHSQFADKLLSLYNEYLAPIVKEEWQPINEYKMVRVQKTIPREGFIKYPFLLKKRSVLRGEVLLMDLYGPEKDRNGITIHVLISLILIDFANEIRKGLSQRRIQSILRSINE